MKQEHCSPESADEGRRVAPQPLPKDRTLLSDLLRYCSENYDLLFKFLQRDSARGDNLRRCLTGEITPDEMEQQWLLLECATNAERSVGVPSHEFLLSYLDDRVLRAANWKEKFADEVAEEGNLRMHQHPWFCWMIVAAYDIVAQVHRDRRNAIRDLRNRIHAALEGGDVPNWNADSSELLFRGHIVRKVRGPSVAGNVRNILDEFQRQQWPRHIDAPKGFDSQSLRETVRRLNAGLRLIRFEADGTGSGVIWKIASG